MEELLKFGFDSIACSYSHANTIRSWMYSFDLFLDAMRIEKVHIIGHGLGGFLGAHFATHYTKRVKSIVFLNSYSNTKYFSSDSFFSPGNFACFLPGFALQMLLMGNLPAPQSNYDEALIKFLSAALADVPSDHLQARIELTSELAELPNPFPSKVPATIIASQYLNTLPLETVEDLKSAIPNARVAILRELIATIGQKGVPLCADFPFLSPNDQGRLELAALLFAHLSQAGLEPTRDVATEVKSDTAQTPRKEEVEVAGLYNLPGKNNYELFDAFGTSFEDNTGNIETGENISAEKEGASADWIGGGGCITE